MNRNHCTQDGYPLSEGDEIWVCADVSGGEPTHHVVGELLENKLLYAEVTDEGMVGAKLSSVFRKKENAYWDEYTPRQGFKRTVCDCRMCSIACEHMPGSLIPGDLELLARHFNTTTEDWEWIKAHFEASAGALIVQYGHPKRIPTLVPKRKADGSCIFLKYRKCQVHEVAPYGCSYHDNHMDDRQAKRRSLAAVQVQSKDHEQDGFLARTIIRLRDEGVVAAPLEERRGRFKAAISAEEKRCRRRKLAKQKKRS
jgi:hypothetical protein